MFVRPARAFMSALLLVLFTVASSASAVSIDQLTSADASAGLKAALDQGVTSAVASLGKADGFWGNPKVKIPLPDNLQRAKSALKLMGKGREIDELERAINRAAEEAVPQSKQLLTSAVKSMTVEDAKRILTGGDDSVTQFFKAKTAPQLTELFLPVVGRVTAKSGLAQQYNSLAGQAAQFGLVKADEATIERYVTQKALDGLYTMIGEEERKIRANPVAAGSDIVRRVFGALK
ncbi:MAG TPA: DUF4197 domain-containing protein [Burkholderiaceae bacterium]|nr:DUF4197 domain-containing protein [Burkholderiaceae bacterium]